MVVLIGSISVQQYIYADPVAIDFFGEVKSTCSITIGEASAAKEATIQLEPVNTRDFSVPGLYKPLRPKYFPIFLKGCMGPSGIVSAIYSATALDTITNTLSNMHTDGPKNIGIILKAAQRKDGPISDITYHLPIAVDSSTDTTIWLMADYFLQYGTATAGPIAAAMMFTVVLR